MTPHVLGYGFVFFVEGNHLGSIAAFLRVLTNKRGFFGHCNVLLK